MMERILVAFLSSSSSNRLWMQTTRCAEERKKAGKRMKWESESEKVYFSGVR
jgi:hypothetical protein